MPSGFGGNLFYSVKIESQAVGLYGYAQTNSLCYNMAMHRLTVYATTNL